MSVKVSIKCDADEYAEYGIVFAPTEASIKVKAITPLKSANISSDDISTLTSLINTKKSQKWTYMDGTLSNIIAYYDEDSSYSYLMYFFKGSKGYNVAYYRDVKQTSDGEIYNIDNLSPDTEGSNFLGFTVYESISEYEQSEVTFTEKYEISIPKT